MCWWNTKTLSSHYERQRPAQSREILAINNSCNVCLTKNLAFFFWWHTLSKGIWVLGRNIAETYMYNVSPSIIWIFTISTTWNFQKMHKYVNVGSSNTFNWQRMYFVRNTCCCTRDCSKSCEWFLLYLVICNAKIKKYFREPQKRGPGAACSSWAAKWLPGLYNLKFKRYFPGPFDSPSG